MKRISFFVHDLAGNPIVRAAPLARALSDDYDVEILGFLQSGDDVYAPYRDGFELKTQRVSHDMTSVLGEMRKLARLATGDIIFACKPLWTSLGPALMASGLGRAKPLFLDVEDDEWVPMGSNWASFLWRDIFKGWRHAIAWKYTMALHPLTRLARGISVSSRKLKRRYGGVLVRHGPDEGVFDPSREALCDRAHLRRDLGLPASAPLALFAGMPQPHKGFELLVEALAGDACSRWELVLAGPEDHSEFARACEVLGKRCHRLGLLPQDRMPQLLSVVDVVPVPQRAMAFAESQMPAKALEAMAMARPIIASRVGDLPELVGDGERGWLFTPGDVASLSAAFVEADVPTVVHDRGRAARAWFLKEASRSVMRERLCAMLQFALL